MGLVQAALSAAGSTMRDQWKEYFYCEAIPSDTIALKGKKKRTSAFSSNRGNDNVITDGSIIVVADGQCMVIVEQGQVVDICAEPGEFKYDSKTQPSLFVGNLGDSVKQVFNEIGKRFTFGGQPATDQRIYYFNTKEITGLKYGTPSPVPFRVVDARAGIDIDIAVKCFGEYSIKVADPILFYTNVCGNFADTYKVSQISDQLKTELLTALQPAFGQLSEAGIRYSSVVSHTMELANALNQQLTEKWSKLRGLEIASIGVSSIKADEEDENLLKQMQKDAAYTDGRLGQAAITSAIAQGIKDAGKNPGGAMNGIVGVNMMANTGNALGVFAQPQAPQAPAAPAADGWTCPKCGKVNTGKFCMECGTQKPAPADKWICPKCGKENEGKFCMECGTQKPAPADKWICPKCGKENEGKFCMECGTGKPE